MSAKMSLNSVNAHTAVASVRRCSSSFHCTVYIASANGLHRQPSHTLQQLALPYPACTLLALLSSMYSKAKSVIKYQNKRVRAGVGAAACLALLKPRPITPATLEAHDAHSTKQLHSSSSLSVAELVRSCTSKPPAQIS